MTASTQCCVVHHLLVSPQKRCWAAHNPLDDTNNIRSSDASCRSLTYCYVVPLLMHKYTGHADAFSSPTTRQLLQQRCPAGCASDGCVLDSGGYRCSRCEGALVFNPDSGLCACPAGRYGGDSTCIDCYKGSYCTGGTYNGPGTPPQTACGSGMTTVGRRSTSARACGASLVWSLHA